MSWYLVAEWLRRDHQAFLDKCTRVYETSQARTEGRPEHTIAKLVRALTRPVNRLGSEMVTLPGQQFEVLCWCLATPRTDHNANCFQLRDLLKSLTERYGLLP